MLVLHCCVFMKHNYSESMLVKYSLDPSKKMDWHSPKMNLVRPVRRPYKWFQERRCKCMESNRIYSHSRTNCMCFKDGFDIIIVTVIIILLQCYYYASLKSWISAFQFYFVLHAYLILTFMQIMKVLFLHAG